MKKEFAVIFKTLRSLPMPAEYHEMSAKLVELARARDGFLRIETVADANGNGVSVSYWRSLEAIKEWKADLTHLEAQARGKNEWYLDYEVQICEVLRSYKKSESNF